MFKVEFGLAIIFVVLSVAVFKDVTENPVQIVRRYQMECIEETRVDPDLVGKVRKGDWYIPMDKIQLVKNWTLCVLKKMGVMTPQGVYKIDVALEKVPTVERSRVEGIIDTCLSKKAIPAEDIAFRFAKCIQRTNLNYTVSIV